MYHFLRNIYLPDMSILSTWEKSHSLRASWIKSIWTFVHLKVDTLGSTEHWLTSTSSVVVAEVVFKPTLILTSSSSMWRVLIKINIIARILTPPCNFWKEKGEKFTRLASYIVEHNIGSGIKEMPKVIRSQSVAVNSNILFTIQNPPFFHTILHLSSKVSIPPS